MFMGGVQLEENVLKLQGINLIKTSTKYFTPQDYESDLSGMFFDVTLNPNSFVGAISTFEFSRHLKDYRDNDNSKLSLRAVPCYPHTPIWLFALDDKNGISLDTCCIGRLERPLNHYSERILESWQNNALEKYMLAERKINDIFRNGEQIPKDFFVKCF